jgi:hypothetical protein
MIENEECHIRLAPNGTHWMAGKFIFFSPTISRIKVVKMKL